MENDQELEQYSIDNDAPIIQLSKYIFFESERTQGGLIGDGPPDSKNISKEMNDISKQHGTPDSEYNLHDDTHGLDNENPIKDERRNRILKNILSHKLAIGLAAAAGLAAAGFIGLLLRRKL